MMKIPQTFDEARALADEASARANVRIRRMHEEERKEQARIARLRPRQRPQSTLDEDLAVDRRLTTDVQYKYAISDIQFYTQYAIMLGHAELLPLLSSIVVALGPS